MEEFSSEVFNALTGIKRDLFYYLYNKYCGPDTPINRPEYLFDLLCYYKTYPICRGSMRLYLSGQGYNFRAQHSRLHKWEQHLANVIDELQGAWDSRFQPRNKLPHIFDELVTGSVDSFPIYIQRPSDGSQNLHYNGKYKRHIVKVQAICDHTGTIIWYSGTHLGVTHDVRLFRENLPPLSPGERILGDKAYIGHHRLIAPIKMRRRALGLTQRQRAYNTVHSWYRATIEHCFAYVKRFKIIGSVYRGHYKLHPAYLDSALKIIMHISSAYTQRHRQRMLHVIPGMPMAPMAAAPPPPPAPEVDTGVRREHLRRNMRVKVWWLDDWWHASITWIPVGVSTVNVRFLGHDHATTGILPRHVQIL